MRSSISMVYDFPSRGGKLHSDHLPSLGLFQIFEAFRFLRDRDQQHNHKGLAMPQPCHEAVCQNPVIVLKFQY